MMPLLKSTSRQGDIGTFYCPLCNRNTAQWFKGAFANEIEVSRGSCRASFQQYAQTEDIGPPLLLSQTKIDR